MCQTPSVILRVVQFYNIHTYILHPTTTAVCEVIITKNKEENDDLFEWFADTSTLLQLSSSEQEKNQQLHSNNNNTNNIGKVCCCFFMLGCGCLCSNRREELALKESLCEEEPQQPQFSCSSTLESRVLLKLCRRVRAEEYRSVQVK